MTKESFGTSARTSGKKLHSPKDYVQMIKDCKKGKMKFSELVEKSEKDLASRGYVFSVVLGWVKPRELERAGISLTTSEIPAVFVMDAKKGWVTRVSPKFMQYMQNKQAEVKAIRDNPQTRKEREMIQEVFGAEVVG